MALSFRPLHPHFVADVSGVDLTTARDPGLLAELRAGMDEYAVLIFHDQPFDDAGQLAFAERFDGVLHRKTGSRVVQENRLGDDDALTDISNLDAEGALLGRDDRRRLYGLGNRLWHTDASFEEPPGRYSMLSARVVPDVAADTEFADMRAAYDTLPASTRERIAGLRVHHSIAYSRSTLGFEFSPEEAARLPGAEHPLVRTLPGSGRRSLYLASHASHVIGWPVPEGRLLLRDLTEHATRRKFVHRHRWRRGDLVIWDNRATMHRACPFDDTAHRREMLRVTTLDVPAPQAL